jgi:hypothetical protein
MGVAMELASCVPWRATQGPVRYLATVGSRQRDGLRRFVLVVAPLLDPTAVLLLLAASSASDRVTWIMPVNGCPLRNCSRVGCTWIGSITSEQRFCYV